MLAPLLAATLALAPPPAPAASQIEGVTVVAPRDPKVVATYPAEGAAIAYGVVVVKVTFDQPMVPQAWSYAHTAEGAFPACLARPRLLGDGRSFALLCSLPAHTAYAVAINAAPGFLSEAGRAAKPHVLQFSTTDVNTASLHDALGLAGLTDADDPIMTWNGAAGAARSSPPPPIKEDVSRTDAPRASASDPR